MSRQSSHDMLSSAMGPCRCNWFGTAAIGMMAQGQHWCALCCHRSCGLWGKCQRGRWCSRIHCCLFACLMYLALLAGVVPITIGFTYNFRLPVPHELVPSDHGINEYKFVRFNSVDTVVSRTISISAVHYPVQEPSGCDGSWLSRRQPVNSDVTVIAVHGLGDRALGNCGGASLLFFAVKPLLCAGFAVLSPDLRNHGNSSNAGPVSCGSHEAHDVLASTRWLIEVQGTHPRKIFLWGMSLGAAAVSYAVALNPIYRAVVLEAPPSAMGLIYDGVAKGVPSWMRWWVAFWHKTGSIDDPYTEGLLRQGRFVTADVLHAHGRQDQIVPFINAELLRTALEARRPILDDITGKFRRLKYVHFFHDGVHVSSWNFPKYFTMYLDFFVEAAHAVQHVGAAADSFISASTGETTSAVLGAAELHAHRYGPPRGTATFV